MQNIIEIAEPLAGDDDDEPDAYAVKWGWFIMIDWLAEKTEHIIKDKDVTEISAVAFVNWALYYQDKEKRENKK